MEGNLRPVRLIIELNAVDTDPELDDWFSAAIEEMFRGVGEDDAVLKSWHYEREKGDHHAHSMEHTNPS